MTTVIFVTADGLKSLVDVSNEEAREITLTRHYAYDIETDVNDKVLTYKTGHRMYTRLDSAGCDFAVFTEQV